MQRLRRLTFFICAFILGSGVLLVFLHQTGLFEVKSVPIELVSNVAGEKPGQHSRGSSILESRLKERLEASLKPLSGKRVWEIDINDLRTALSRDEWVKDVLISRSLPNEVRVRVRPKLAAFIFVNTRGDFIPVTDEGNFLKPLTAGMLPDVPFLRGEVFAQDLARREAAVKIILSLSSQGPLSRRNISELGWTNEDGYSLTLISPKVEVKLGDDQLDLKALRVAQVLNYLSANDLKGRVIDASFSKKVLVRLRKGP
jgi:cell division protein FtsQ